MSRPDTQKGGVNMISPLDLDPREEFQDRMVSPIEELEQVQIGTEVYQTTSIVVHLYSLKKGRKSWQH
jgi:hypothetical protein